MSKNNANQINSLIVKNDELKYTVAPIDRINDRAQVAIEHVMEKRQGFLQRFLADEGTRAAIHGELMIIKDEFEFRRRALAFVKRKFNLSPSIATSI